METNKNTIEKLEEIFNKHKNDRICVLGTICLGKTTLIKQLKNCVDVDDELPPLLNDKEKDFLHKAHILETPWTEEIGDEVERLTKEKVKIKPGFPLFGTIILDCDVIVYLDIDYNLLSEHCKKRKMDLCNALEIKKSIEDDLKALKEKNNKIIYYYLLVNE